MGIEDLKGPLTTAGIFLASVGDIAEADNPMDLDPQFSQNPPQTTILKGWRPPKLDFTPFSLNLVPDFREETPPQQETPARLEESFFINTHFSPMENLYLDDHGVPSSQPCLETHSPMQLLEVLPAENGEEKYIFQAPFNDGESRLISFSSHNFSLEQQKIPPNLPKFISTSQEPGIKQRGEGFRVIQPGEVLRLYNNQGDEQHHIYLTQDGWEVFIQERESLQAITPEEFFVLAEAKIAAQEAVLNQQSEKESQGGIDPETADLFGGACLCLCPGILIPILLGLVSSGFRSIVGEAVQTAFTAPLNTYANTARSLTGTEKMNPPYSSTDIEK